MKNTLIFTGFTYIISWFIALIFVLNGGRYGSPASYILIIGYMFVPLLVAVCLQKWLIKASIRDLGFHFNFNKWWIWAWVFPVLYAIATMGVNLLFPDVTYNSSIESILNNYKELMTEEQYQKALEEMQTLPVHPFFLVIIQALIAGATINAVAAFGEEAGWRGFLYNELIHLGFWKSSLIIGIIWGLWHAPLILLGHNYPEHPEIGVGMMILWCILLTPPLILSRVSARSVIPAAIFHGTLNASYGLSVMLITGGNDLINGITGVSGMFILILVNLLLLMFYRKNIPSSP